jgi:hypothetical protein
MGKFDELKGPRKGSVGFAFATLQRRLASSPEAIFQSLRRRRERLESRLREGSLFARGQQFSARNLETPPEDDDDLSAEEQEELEGKLTDTATESQCSWRLFRSLTNAVDQSAQTAPGPVLPRPTPPGPGPIPPPKAKTFYGSADVTPATAKVRLITIAEEIIAVLSSDPNATVKVTVEIAADFPDGASDQIKRAVSENATHLGFKNKMWEYVWIDLTRSFRNY